MPTQKLQASAATKKALVTIRVADLHDDDLVDEAGACAVVGGENNPIHRSTFWKGIGTGIYSKPFKTGPGDRLNRWRVGRLRADIRRAENDAAE